MTVIRLCSRNDNPDVVSGHGTMGLEIVDQVEGVDAVIVPADGGSLLAGTCIAIKALYPSIKIIVRPCLFKTTYPSVLWGIVNEVHWNSLLLVEIKTRTSSLIVLVGLIVVYPGIVTDA